MRINRNRSARWSCAALLAATACSGAQTSHVDASPADGATAYDAATPSPADDVGDPFLDAAAQDAAVVAKDASVDAPACGDGGCAPAAFDGDPSAVFVAFTGADSAPGTIAAPVRSIAKGVALAQAAHKDVYVCDAIYTENVVLATTAVSLHGGYDCVHAWAPVEDRATIAPASGVPLSVQGVTGALTIEGLNLKAPDAVSAGDSSIAAIVANVVDVTFHHVTFTAGAGANGQDGASAVASTTPAPPGAAGATYTITAGCVNGGLGASFCAQNPMGGHSEPIATCLLGQGGRGGDGLNGYRTTTPVSAQAGAPAGIGGIATTNFGIAGGPGANGATGAPAAAGFGALTSTGYTPSNAGAAGAIGGPGGGGGGGAGELPPLLDADTTFVCTVDVGGAGGEGGYGGCGGAGGAGGGGGGASIALVSFASGAHLTACTLSAGPGGAGGNAGSGAPGQPGGVGGAGGSGALAGGPARCPDVSDPFVGSGYSGGAGGRGGTGGAGGPGGGGPSLGIAWSGGAPSVDTTVTIDIGQGGRGGAAVGAVDGTDGVSAAVYPPPAADAGAGK